MHNFLFHSAKEIWYIVIVYIKHSNKGWNLLNVIELPSFCSSQWNERSNHLPPPFLCLGWLISLLLIFHNNMFSMDLYVILYPEILDFNGHYTTSKEQCHLSSCLCCIMAHINLIVLQMRPLQALGYISWD